MFLYQLWIRYETGWKMIDFYDSEEGARSSWQDELMCNSTNALEYKVVEVRIA